MERYDIVAFIQGEGMRDQHAHVNITPDPTGEWVKHADVRVLEERCKVLETLLATVKLNLRNHMAHGQIETAIDKALSGATT